MFCRFKYVKCIVVVIFVLVVLVNIYIFWGVLLSKISDSFLEECIYGNYFNEFVFFWIFLIVGFFLLFIIMVIINSFIV